MYIIRVAIYLSTMTTGLFQNPDHGKPLPPSAASADRRSCSGSARPRGLPASLCSPRRRGRTLRRRSSTRSPPQTPSQTPPRSHSATSRAPRGSPSPSTPSAAAQSATWASGTPLCSSRRLADPRSHGDLLFLSYKPRAADPDSHPAMQATAPHPQPAQPDPSHPKTHTEPPMPNTIPLRDLSSVQEPEIDQYWEKQTGKIERKRDPAFCRHGDKAMCDYCMPLEVYRRPLRVLPPLTKP